MTEAWIRIHLKILSLTCVLLVLWKYKQCVNWPLYQQTTWLVASLTKTTALHKATRQCVTREFTSTCPSGQTQSSNSNPNKRKLQNWWYVEICCSISDIFLKWQLVNLGKWAENQLVRKQNLLIRDERTSVKIFTAHLVLDVPCSITIYAFRM